MDYTIGYLPHPEGDYNQSNPYTPMAVVHLNGESFISKVNVPAGIIPRVSTDWTNYWQPFAEGTQGNQGATGARGAIGAQGYQGNQGATGAGSIWWYTEDNLDDGKLPYNIDDLKGPDAKPKESDYILDVGGKVFIIDRIDRTNITGWTEANNIKGATGAQGPQGARGIQGYQGIQGIQGNDGNPGSNGTQGPQGAQGMDGAYAAQGIQGAKGAQGYVGPTGTPSTQVETWSFTMGDGTIVTKQIYIQ